MPLSANFPEVFAKKICADRQMAFVEEVGSGAFKTTFHVRKDADDFALKLIVRGSDKARVEREIAALMICDHPNICRLLDFGEIEEGERSIIYLIEEYLHGGTLSTLLTKGALPLFKVKSIGKQLICAITHLAQHRITHRDIKPENIMFRGDGSAVLVDFGIARHLAASSLTKTFLMQGPGTPYYTSPEQMLNDKNLIDWRSDQFSLGVTLSLAALGMHPFSESNSAEQILGRISAREEPVELFRVAAKNAGLEALIKMVDPWPVKRYGRPEQLLEAWNH